MSTQSKSFQRRILDGAKRQHELHRLYWLVEIRWPLSAVKGRTSLEKEAKRYTNACHPERWVPAIPVGPCPETSRHWAEMLCALFASSNRGRGMDFYPALADLDTLAGAPWYIYGEGLPTRDQVCERCGGISNEPGACCSVPTWTLLGRHGQRVHISRSYSQRSLCGREVRAQWVTSATVSDRRAWPLPWMCDSCFKLYQKEKGERRISAE